jgi:hypothetical protein
VAFFSGLALHFFPTLLWLDEAYRPGAIRTEEWSPWLYEHFWRIPHWQLQALAIVTMAACACAIVGFRTRVSAAIAGLGCYAFASFNGLHLQTLALIDAWAILILWSICGGGGAAFSVDARLAGTKGTPPREPRLLPGLILYQVLLGVFFSGVEKLLAGWPWTNEMGVILSYPRGFIVRDWVAASPWLHGSLVTHTLSWLTLAVELGTPIALLSKRTRLVALAAFEAFFLGIITMLEVPPLFYCVFAFGALLALDDDEVERATTWLRRRLPRATAAATLAIALAALAACKKPPPAPEAKPVPVVPVSELLPTALDAADYVGAAACAECHQAEYDAWKKSPHGRAMAVASPDTVLASFDGSSLSLPDGKITFTRGAGGFAMDIASRAGTEHRPVDVVLASGRQHQLYVVRSAAGGLTLLPAVWSTKTKAWLPLSLYQAADLDPASPNYWGAQDMARGCVSCHLSQYHRRVDAEGARSEWVDFPVNCESCHGPGREHVRRRRAGDTREVYRDLKDLGSVEESRVCGGCHGFQLKRYVFPPADDGLPQIFVTSLLNQSLRPDGTQHLTSYQYPGHVLSAGFREKVLRCKDCHAPHGLEARAKDGASAVGALTNNQCTTCHEELVAPRPVAAHTHHPASVKCVDCHMSYSWIGDDDRRHQRTSDHSISVPHPQESLDLGTPNACNTCHQDKTPAWSLAALKKWGAKNALEARDWVESVALARKSAPGAAARLVKILADPTSVTYLQASALDLLAVQPHDPGLVPAITPFATSPDPYLRASALRALDVHDDAGRARWRAEGLADAHPYVRMEAFSLYKDVRALPPAAIDRQLADVMAFMSPPTDGLVHLVTVRHKRGELREALAVIDALEKLAVPRERQRLNLDEVRARIEADLARRDGGGP